MRRATLASLPLLLLLGCGDDPAPTPTPAPPPEPVAELAPEPTPAPEVPAPRSLGAEDPLPSGEAAAAAVGDWLLASADGRVRFVISALDRRAGFSASGGNLVDITLDDGPDRFDGMTTWFEREFPRQAAYTSAAIDGKALVVTGADDADTALSVTTRWEIESESPPGAVAALSITTTVTNSSNEPRPDYDLGDIVAWGGLRHFAPRAGFALKGTADALPWVGAEGEEHALLLAGVGPMTGPHGSSWSDPVWTTTDLPPGESVTYSRRLLVGRTLGELAASVTEGRTITVKARQEDGAPIPGAMLSVASDGNVPLLVGRADAHGDLSMVLPERALMVSIEAPGRRPGRPVPIDPTGEVAVLVQASAPGALEVTLVDGDTSDYVAGRLRLWGVDDTPTPNLGPDSAAVGGDRANLGAGTQTVPVPPGTYRVVASRGPAWSLAESLVTIPPGGKSALRLSLRQLVPLDGWLQCDLHQHSALSADSAVPPRDGLIASAAEGLDCIATTEHDVVADWTRDLAATALPDPFVWLAGLEVSSPQQGHYNVYPWPADVPVIEHAHKGAYELTALIRERAPGAVLQVNHPRYGKIGAFNAIDRADMRSELDYDALEILNGKAVADADTVLLDVVGLLRLGRVTTMVGTSDSHRLVGEERGLGRSYVWVGDAAAGPSEGRQDRLRGAATEAIRRTRRVTASTGPFLDLRFADDHVEITMQAPEWMPVDAIELYAGDLGGGDGSPEASVSPIATFPAYGAVDGGLRTVTIRQRVIDPGAGAPSAQRWFFAIARGAKPMEPWSDAPAWAMTTPITWKPF